MNPDDLIRIARYLASTGTGVGIGRPSRADLRRAVSTTYYALFHALAECCANTLIGAPPPPPPPATGANRRGAKPTGLSITATPKTSATAPK